MKTFTKIAVILLLYSIVSQAEEIPKNGAELSNCNLFLSDNQSDSTKPQLFAPGIIPYEGIQHCFPAISPDGSEILWITSLERGSRKIMHISCKSGIWTGPMIAPFSGVYLDQSPVFSSDGNRLYFCSNRPGGFGGFDIWYVDKTDSGWSQSQNLGSPPNTESSESQMSISNNGTIYFVSKLENVEWNMGIYRSKIINGVYQKPQLLDSNINTKYVDYTPFIASNESYLLFASSRPGTSSQETDIYISFQSAAMVWSEPQRISRIVNNGSTVKFPYVTHNNKYLLYRGFDTMGDDYFYWVHFDMIESQFRNMFEYEGDR